jgi:hypothetical protein
MPEAPTVCTSHVDASTLLTCAGQLVSRYGLVVVLAVGHLVGVPILGVQPGQSLLKDLVLLGVALWTFGESLSARRKRDARTDACGVS